MRRLLQLGRERDLFPASSRAKTFALWFALTVGAGLTALQAAQVTSVPHFVGTHSETWEHVLIRALGPTLGQSPFNVPNVLPDPFLDLRDANGMRITANDNWKSSQQTQIQATGLAPPNDAESAIATTLAPGSYTAIVTGVDNTTGNALLEVYGLN